MTIPGAFSGRRFRPAVPRNSRTRWPGFGALVSSAPNSRTLLVVAHKGRGRSWRSLTFHMLPQRMRIGIRPPHNLFGEAVVRAHKVR